MADDQTLRAIAPELAGLLDAMKKTLWQYRSDMEHPRLDDGQRQRRIAHIDAVLAQMDALA